MAAAHPYPGTPQHQSLLQAIVSHYTDDPRILAVIVFGSLGCGNWDPYSDLDLDIIIGDNVHINVVQELERMIHSFPDIGEMAALIIPHGEDAADVVLASSMELSVRYHTLMSTSMNIIESMGILWGCIDEATIKAAALANQNTGQASPGQLLDMCVRYALETDNALQRRQLWMATELEHHIRGLLMELFAQSHDNPRPIHAFQKEANLSLQTLLGATLPQYDLLSIQKALLNLLDILENSLEQFAGGQVKMTLTHLKIIKQIRERQRKMNPDGV
jgi:predicted nucleotidyltransferase